MKLCVLHSSYEGSDTPFRELDTEFDLATHFAGYRWEKHGLKKATAVKQVAELSKKGFDVFVNLCDGAWDEDRAGIEVVQALERLDLPFTGAASSFYDPSRETMKRVCHYYGISTPRHRFAANDEELATISGELHFPAIVKHPSSYSSVGMTRNSRVETPGDLLREGKRFIEAYGSVLAEEFIEGREFTVLVAENSEDPRNPHAYEPVEFVFPEGESFKHFDLKWKDYGRIICKTCEDRDLAEQMKDISRRFFTALGGSGYGRCDIRVNDAGEAFMLEINPNCAVFGPLSDPGSADYVLMNDPEGHGGFIRRIIGAARLRPRNNARPWELRLSPDGQYGMFARRDIAAGETIEPYEERPHCLVTRSRVEKTWDGVMKSWFRAYSYPLTDDIWVMWSPDPMEWKPINHSCDPNSWLEGLNLSARSAISKGDEITIDYATFCNEEMEEFQCRCGSPRCRGTIRGTDYLTVAVRVYGDHVSDYVNRKRKEASCGDE